MITANLTLILLATSGILYALLFASVASRLLKGHRAARSVVAQHAAPLLLAAVLLSFLWTLGKLALSLRQPDLLTGDLLLRLLHYALLPLALLFLTLTWQYLHPRSLGLSRIRGRLPWTWWALGLAWLAIVVALYEDLPAGLAQLLGGTAAALPVLSYRFAQGGQWLAFAGLVLGWAGFLVAAAILTLQAYRRSPRREQRQRIRYWGLALACTFAGGLLFLAAGRGWGNLLHLMGSSGVAYLVLAQRLPRAAAGKALRGVNRLTRGTLSYLVVFLLMVTLIAAAFLLGYYALLAVPGYPPWAVAFALALLLAAVVHPLLDRLHALLAGPPPPTRVGPDRALAEYATLVGNILDLDDLAIVALGLCQEIMDVRRGALYVVEGEQGGEHVHLRAVASTDQEADPAPGPAGDLHGPQRLRRPALSSTSPLVEYLQREQRPLTQIDLDLQPRFHSLPPDEQHWLRELGMEVYVPIRADRRWLGLLVLGPPRSGEPYGEDDLNLLGKLAVQTAVALQNTRQFEALKARNARSQRRIEELAAERQALARLDAGRSEMMRITAREMRQPLSGIEGYIDLLREFLRLGRLRPEQAEEMMQGIGSAVWRLAEMSQALQEAARVETALDTGAVSALEIQALPLERVVEAAAAQWAGALKQRSLTFSMQGLAGLPSIMGDGRQLQRAFAELLHNAIRATPDGGQIRVRGHLRDGEQPVEDQSVEIVVADTGLGIARADLVRVFDPFYRRGEVILHSGGRCRFKAAGPGLGLTQVRCIVEAHGGRIWADSPGYDEANYPGTEVHVVLPVRDKKKPPRNPPPPFNGFEEVQSGRRDN
jgi:signal transduction histidine kinase